jgi:hypothetical protein
MAPVIGSGLPLPDIYKNRQAGAEQAYQAALADLAKQQRSQFTQYGFQGDVNEETGAVNASIDPNLQFGLVQQMLRGHSASRTSLKEGTSGRGLGRSGLAKQRQNLLKFLQQGDVASLGQRFNSGIAGIFGQRGNARRNRDMEFNNAEQDALSYAIANGLFNRDPSGVGITGNDPAASMMGAPGGGYQGGAGLTGQQQQPGGAYSSEMMLTDPAQTAQPAPFDPAAYQQELASRMSQASYQDDGEYVMYDPLNPGTKNRNKWRGY